MAIHWGTVTKGLPGRDETRVGSTGARKIHDHLFHDLIQRPFSKAVSGSTSRKRFRNCFSTGDLKLVSKPDFRPVFTRAVLKACLHDHTVAVLPKESLTSKVNCVWYHHIFCVVLVTFSSTSRTTLILFENLEAFLSPCFPESFVRENSPFPVLVLLFDHDRPGPILPVPCERVVKRAHWTLEYKSDRILILQTSVA